MSGALTQLRQAAAELLVREGIQAVCAFEPERRRVWDEPVAAVTLVRAAYAQGSFQDYLGVCRDEGAAVYGGALEVTLGLDIYGPRDCGENACRAALDRMAEALLTQRLEGLSALELESGGMEFLENEGLYRLPVRCKCRGWLTVRDDGEQEEFGDFVVRGRFG